MITKVVAMSSRAEARKRELEKLFSPENFYKKRVQEEIPGLIKALYTTLLKFRSDQDVGALRRNYLTLREIYISTLADNIEYTDKIELLKGEVDLCGDIITSLTGLDRAKGCKNYAFMLMEIKSNIERIAKEGSYIRQYIQMAGIEELFDKAYVTRTERVAHRLYPVGMVPDASYIRSANLSPH